MQSEQRGWGAFGAYSLSGELPREGALTRLEAKIERLCETKDNSCPDTCSELASLRASWAQAARNIYANLEPWETVFVARHPRRPLATDYIDRLTEQFCELHGDRRYGDDSAVVTGFGYIGGQGVMIVGHNRGRSLKERVACNFGCAHPEGYRKALAKMKLAAKFGVPIVSFIDTPGAYPGMEAEERGIAQAIAENLAAMPRLPVPIVAVVIGEGGSGGALGIGVSDRIAMLEHSVFSVISPEGCAAILWNTSTRSKEAAAALKLRAPDLIRLGLIDEIIPEPIGGAHRDHRQAAAAVGQFIVRTLEELTLLAPEELVEQRRRRIRAMGSACDGIFREASPTPAGSSGSSCRKPNGRSVGRGRVPTVSRMHPPARKASRPPMES